MSFELVLVPIVKPADVNLILGQAHFVKTVEDLHEALVGAVPGIRFGVAFCEASGKRLVRVSGTDPELRAVAAQNALAIGAGHSFVILLRGTYAVNVLQAVKAVPEVCSIFCASANDVDVIVAAVRAGRGIIGVIDGQTPGGIETEEDEVERKALLRKIGYKL